MISNVLREVYDYVHYNDLLSLSATNSYNRVCILGIMQKLNLNNNVDEVFLSTMKCVRDVRIRSSNKFSAKLLEKNLNKIEFNGCVVNSKTVRSLRTTELILCGCTGEIGVDDLNVLTNLKKLCVTRHSGWIYYSHSFMHLPYLEYLTCDIDIRIRLDEMYYMKYLDGMLEECTNSFSSTSLKTLKLRKNCYGLEENNKFPNLIKLKTGVYPSSIFIENLTALNSLDIYTYYDSIDISLLTSLKKIKVRKSHAYHIEQLKLKTKVDLPSVSQLKLGDNIRISNEKLARFPNLKFLELIYAPEIRLAHNKLKVLILNENFFSTKLFATVPLLEALCVKGLLLESRDVITRIIILICGSVNMDNNALKLFPNLKILHIREIESLPKSTITYEGLICIPSLEYVGLDTKIEVPSYDSFTKLKFFRMERIITHMTPQCRTIDGFVDLIKTYIKI